MSDKNYLVVGHKGFIGNNLVKKLEKSKKNIYLISRKIDKKNKKKNEFSYDVFNDFRWFKHLKSDMTIFFLAFDNDLYKLENDKNYLNNVINFCICFNKYVIKKNLKINLIFTSTVTIYGVTKNKELIDENYEDDPISIYDYSKLYFEKIFKYFLKESGIKFVSLRLSNIYGFNSTDKQKNRGFLNKMIHNCIHKKTINIYGTGNNLRNYLYIDDLVEALLITAKKIKKLESREFLLCNEMSHSFNEVIKIISANLNRKIKIQNKKYSRKIHPIEKRSFIGNNSLFRKKTGWKPLVKLHVGIDKMIKQNLNK